MTPPPVPDRSNGLATASLVCGICGFFSGPISGIPAIITGHLAHKRIRQSGGVLGGGGAATAGLVLGWVTSALSLLVIGLIALATPQIHKALARANLAENLNNARMVKMELDAYATDHDGDYPPDLATLSSGSYSPVEIYRYKSPKSKVERDWLYVPGQTNTSPVGNIILASPETVGADKSKKGALKRIVVFIDGSARVIPEPSYQHQLRVQGAPPP